MPSESAIILPVPEAESAVGRVRRLHDPLAGYGVPAHVTLLYPFAHPSKVAEVVGALQDFFGGVLAFDYLFVGVRRFPATAYLHPEPSAPFIRLTDGLVQRWPDYPPYGGAFSTVIPHLTVADRVQPDVLDAVEREVRPHLPVACRATAAWLVCSDERGFWSRHTILPFSES